MTFPLKSTATQSVVVGHETAAKSVTPAIFVAVQLAAPPVGSVEVATYPTWSTATQSVVDGQETWPKGRPYVWSPKSNFAGADQPNAPPAAAPADEAPNGTPTRTTAPNASQCHDRRKVRGRLRLGRSTINPAGGFEAMPAVVGAEVERLAVVLRLRCGVRHLHLHPAHGIDGVARAAAKAPLVPSQPPEAGEHDEEDDVEVGGVVPVEARRRDDRRPLRRLDRRRAEEVLDREPGDAHNRPEQRKQLQRQAAAVVAAVDQQQRQRDQVGEDEADDAAEADAALPERGGERH